MMTERARDGGKKRERSAVKPGMGPGTRSARAAPMKPALRKIPGRSGNPSRDVILPVLGCGLLALMLRITYLLEAADNPFWRHLGLDMEGYDRWARAVISGQGLGEAPFTQAPLFPLLLALGYQVLGPDPVRALWLHLVPGVGAVVLVTLAAGRWRGPLAAWAAGLLLALYKPAIFYTGVLLPPSWVLGLSALFLIMALRAFDAPERRSRPFVLGLSGGVLALGQPAALSLVLPAAWYLHRARARSSTTSGSPADEPRSRERTETRRGILSYPLTWLALGVALPLLSSWLYNGIAGKSWVPVAVNGGVNLYIGNGPEANGAYVRPPGLREDRDLLGIAAARAAVAVSSGQEPTNFGPAAANRYWTRRALDEAARHPIRTLSLVGRKLLFFLGQYEVPQVESLPFERRYSVLLRAPFPGMALLVALSVLGALLLYKDDSIARWLLWSVGALTLGVLLFFVTARFRLPAAPWLAVFGGGGIARAVALARMRPAEGRAAREGPTSDVTNPGRRRQLAAIAVALVTLVVLQLNLTGLDRQAGDGQHYFRLGVMAEKDNQIDEAMKHYRQALELDPSLAKAEVNVGTLLARSGRYAEARPHLERAVALDPLSARGHLNLGQLFQVEGKPEEALAEFGRSIEVDPELLPARESMAYLLYERGDLEGSQVHLQEIARRATPASAAAVRAQTLLSVLPERLSGSRTPSLLQADLLLSQGRSGEALKQYEEALRDPESAGAARRMLSRLGSSLETAPPGE